MRDIEFRGKRKDNGEWVIGGFTNDAIDNPRITTKNPDGGGLLFHFVIPETVGQWTGLKDKNGVKIFEGDIVKFKAIKGYDAYNEIVWNEKEAGFFSIGKRKRERKNYVSLSYMINVVGIEVIGNIHDSPELLEAKP